MQSRPLGKSALSVSPIGSGLWGMGAWTGSNDADSLRALQLSLDLGCTFYDSAWAYGSGRSDTLLGQLVKNNPSKRPIVASKIPPKNMKWPTSPSDTIDDVFPVDHIIEYAERIRTALQVDTLDVLQFHGWEDAWTTSPTFERAVHELKSRRLTRAFGISLNRLQSSNGIRAVQTGLVDCVQVVYNIFDQAAADELFPLCLKHNVGVIARCPLDDGSLGGKLTVNTTFPADDWRARYFTPEKLPEIVRRANAIQAILPPGLSLPEAALRFVLSHPAVSTTIAGMRQESHVKSNIAAANAGPLDRPLLTQLESHRWDRT
ncbi:MAG: aldo/keto reductase [Planctomycetota bacterium]